MRTISPTLRSVTSRKSVGERDEGEALEEAAADLIRLDRYEHRTRLRHDRAILGFINRKLIKRLEAGLAEQAKHNQANISVQ